MGMAQGFPTPVGRPKKKEKEEKSEMWQVT